MTFTGWSAPFPMMSTRGLGVRAKHFVENKRGWVEGVVAAVVTNVSVCSGCNDDGEDDNCAKDNAEYLFT